MDLTFSPAEEAFRAELRAWLAANVPPDWRGGEPPEFASLDDEVALPARLAAPSRGGTAGSASTGRASTAVAARPSSSTTSSRRRWRAARAPEIINRIGVNLVGPTLIAHGTDEQQAALSRRAPAGRGALVPAVLRARRGLRPDRAAHPRRAPTATGGCVNGQKVWTSYAQFARWGILLARTDPAAPKAKGISYLIFDMQAPGRHGPSAPADDRQRGVQRGLPGGRLRPARAPGRDASTTAGRSRNTTLAHERGTSPRQLVIHRMLLDDLLRLAREERDGRRPRRPIRWSASASRSTSIEVEITRLNNWRTLTRLQTRQAARPGVELHQALLERDEPAHARHRDGAARSARSLLAAAARTRWRAGGWRARISTIAPRRSFAGTSEIQRNILAERVLGCRARAEGVCGFRGVGCQRAGTCAHAMR